MNEIRAELCGWLLDYYLLTTAFLTVVLLILSVAGQPVRRMAVAWSAMVGLVFLTVVTVLPGWPRSYVGHWAASGWANARPSVGTAGREANASEAIERDLNTRDETAGGRVASVPDISSERPANRVQPPSKNLRDRRGSLARPSPLAAQSDLPGIVTGLFVAGWLLTAAWLVLGVAQTMRLFRHAYDAPEATRRLLSRLTKESPQPPRLLMSDTVEQALGIGVIRPVILLPKRFATPNEETAMVLAHEWAHIRNGDLRLLAISRMLQLLLFAQPLFWLLRRQIRIDQELLADADAGHSDPVRYAETLLHWFKTNAPDRSRVLTASLGLWERPQSLKRRIAMLLKDARLETNCPRAWKLTTSMALTLLAVTLSIGTLREDVAAAADSPIAANGPVAANGPIAVNGPAAAGRPVEPLTVVKAPARRETAGRIEAPAPDENDVVPSRPAAVVEEPLPSPNVVAQARRRYQTAAEAWRVGAALYNSRNYAESQEPLEAALKMAPDDEFRVRVYESLLQSYRLLPEIDKYVTASDFILSKVDNTSKQSLIRRSLLSFVYQRGKLDDLRKRYEKRLKKEPQDRTALFILSELYARYDRDPERAVEIAKRLAKVDRKSDEPLNVNQTAQLAMQYVRARKYKEGAQLYEKIAPLDENLAAWHWKEAAAAWLKADDKKRARAAAIKSSESAAEKRSELLTHFWHKGVADVLLAVDEPAKAIPHFEQAIESTRIEGYVKASRAGLEQAREQAAGN